MADVVSLKEGASQLVERLATEIESFLLLGSLILTLDWFLYIFDNRTILNFDWSYSAHGLNIGAVLLFLAGFSFTMTVLSPMFLGLSVYMYILIGWYKLDNKGDLVPYGYVRITELRDFALSNKENFYLMDLVEKKSAIKELVKIETMVKDNSPFVFW